jgi:DNA-binding XRE family transcriptional regulator
MKTIESTKLTGSGLRVIRKELLGLTQEQMAKRLGIKRLTVIRYEHGAVRIPLAVAISVRCIASHGAREEKSG